MQILRDIRFQVSALGALAINEPSGLPLARHVCILSHVAAAQWSVRTFAALDLYGTAGNRGRRRIVTAEFALGTAGLIALSAILFQYGRCPWAIWALGCPLNYGALAVHAVALYPRGRLVAALRDVEIRSEIRRYSIAQLLLLVPGLIAATAVSQALHRDCNTAA